MKTLEASEETSELSLLRRRVKEIERLVDLLPDWNSYGADPPSATAAEAAISAVRHLDDMELVPDRIVPSAEGGIGIAFRNGLKYADIEFFNNGEILALTANNGERIEIWPVGQGSEEIKHSLSKIRDYINS
jgi:hypothetical protein